MFITEKGSEINLETIEQNIGISKDFNNFELNNAVARKDVLRANLISNYFAANPKNNPFSCDHQCSIRFFHKTLIYHTLKDKSKIQCSFSK